VRGGERGARRQQGLGVGGYAVMKVSALLGYALTALADAAWSLVFRVFERLETPPPTPEQLRQQAIREQEEARTEYQRKAREDR